MNHRLLAEFHLADSFTVDPGGPISDSVGIRKIRSVVISWIGVPG